MRKKLLMMLGAVLSVFSLAIGTNAAWAVNQTPVYHELYEASTAQTCSIPSQYGGGTVQARAYWNYNNPHTSVKPAQVNFSTNTTGNWYTHLMAIYYMDANGIKTTSQYRDYLIPVDDLPGDTSYWSMYSSYDTLYHDTPYNDGNTATGSAWNPYGNSSAMLVARSNSPHFHIDYKLKNGSTTSSVRTCVVYGP